jgi:hypothetical protein
MTIKLHSVKKKLFKNPKVRAEYERLGPEFSLIQTMIEARTKAGLSQDELAERMGTTQKHGSAT